MAKTLFDDSKAVVKIDCPELQHSHEISKLIGSPPGYLGHRETQPLITQETLDQLHREKLNLSLVLFDEIEKASDAMRQLLLGILDKATLTLGDNRRMDFSRAMIFMTSNLGAREMARLTEGGMGFRAHPSGSDVDLDEKLYRVATEAARRKFSPEFINRIDKVIVFRPLGHAELEQVLDLEITCVRERVAKSRSGCSLVLDYLAAAREFLLAEGTDGRCGARHLKRATERHVVFPLANLIATWQVSEGDIVVVDHNPLNACLSFAKQACEALVRIAAV